jgi:hypothetical protein
MRNVIATFMVMSLWVVSILALGGTVFADQLTMQEGTNISLSATAGPNSTLTISSTDTDENVKVSSDDTTPGFLNGKLVSGSGIILTEGSGGGDETLTISSSETLTTKGDVLVHDGTSETRLAVGASGQFLTSDSSGALLWANPAEGDQLFNSNVMLNAYRTAENGNRPILKMIDGVVNAFESNTGVDATASTNEIFDSVNTFFGPTGTGTKSDKTAFMTGSASPSGTVTTSDDSNEAAWKAFDATVDSHWRNTFDNPECLTSAQSGPKELKS